MPTLTPEMWAENFAALRPHVYEQWPSANPRRVDAVGGDWDGLVKVLSEAAGQAGEVIDEQLRALEIPDDDLALATMITGSAPASVEDDLRLGDGFAENERERIVERLEKLNRRLKRFPADGTSLELSIKDRDQLSQKVTLECHLPGFPLLVATSRERDLRDALIEIREDLWRQVDEAVNRRSAGRG